MKMHAANLPRRYPGLKPFERSQSGVFHGREEDIQRLSNLILRERLVVLFSKSGIGKTSLLQAGVGPELERQEFVPIFLRADKTDKPLLETFQAVLQKSSQLSGYDHTGEQANSNHTLWEQMKRYEFDLNGLPATPVLIFDQFEEVFTLAHSDASRRSFLADLADLANETMPESIRKNLLDHYQQTQDGVSVEEMQWWENQPDVRIILSIRSDFLHFIDQMSPLIPGILRNRYQLQPLSREKARVAIERPAAAEGAYASPVFHYTEPALEEMIGFLAGQNLLDKTASAATESQVSKQRDEIETVNLQIVCQDVEEKMIDYQKPANFAIEPEFYGKIAGLRASIRNFYFNQMQAFPKAYVERILQKAQFGEQIKPDDKRLSAEDPEALRTLAQKVIEEYLVTSSNRRNSVVDDTLLDENKVTPDFLDTLVDKSRLLRKEPRLDDFYYEISHDTLLPAIIESRDKRRQKEFANQEKQALEAQLLQEAQRRKDIEAELRIARQNRKMARVVSYTLFGVLLAFSAFGLWMTYDYIDSVKEELRDTEQNVQNEFFDAAIPIYEKMLANPRRKWVLKYFDQKDVDSELNKVQRLQACYKGITDSMNAGDERFFQQKDYAGALLAYHHAYDSILVYRKLNFELSNIAHEYRIDTAYIHKKRITADQRIESALQILITQFKVAQRDFETFSEAGVWNMALRSLRKMQNLLPTAPQDIKALRSELNLDEAPKDYVKQEIQRCKQQLRRRGVVLKE